ncbi:MAG: KH domain-containing protein [Oscillospiraceae bacterium]|nr:KH domain-containing protein [Oscillospiraceae bacterium]
MAKTEKIEIFTAKTFDEAKEMAAEAFGADMLDIQFEIIEQPKKTLFGSKGDFRVRAIYETAQEAMPQASLQTSPQTSKGVQPPRVSVANQQPAPRDKFGKFGDTSAPKTSAVPIADPAELEQFKPTVEYVDGILKHLGIKGYGIEVNKAGDNNIINITGESLGAIIGRRGETLDALQYLSILANNRAAEENARLRLVVDCNGYREKRTETLEVLAVRTCAKVIKQGRRVTLEPMNPYERRIIHSKVSEIEGVFSNSIGEEPYRKVVISAERVKPRENRDNRDRRDNRGGRDNRSGGAARDNRDNRGGGGFNRGRTDNDVIPQRIPGEVSNAVHSKSYKQSAGFSTSFEREYKRDLDAAAPADTPISPEAAEASREVMDSTALYGKIEL